MIRRIIPILFLLALLIVPSSAFVVGTTWNQSNSSSSAFFGCIDGNGNSMVCPDFDTVEPWMSMGRVNNSATQYQTMVQVKRHYIKTENVTLPNNIHWMNFSISDVPAAGFVTDPWHVINGTEVPWTYIGAYEGSTYNVTTNTYVGDPASINITANIGDKLSSVAGQKPTSGLGKATPTLPAFRTTAQNRGTGWELQSFQSVSVIQRMYIIEYRDWNSQNVIGPGVTQIADDGATNMAMPTGLTGGVGANSTNLANTTGQITTVHYKTSQATKPMSYRGVENFYGNLYKWVDGLNIKGNNVPWVADHDFASDVFAHPYVDTGLTLPAANGYVSNLAYAAGFDWAFLPSAVAGSSSTYLCDYHYQDTGNRAALLGGRWSDGAYAGPFSWSLNNAASSVSRSIGARLAFTPPLYANFTFDNSTSSVSFTDTSYNISTRTGLLTPPTSWNWSFGDGSLSTSQSPTHAYTTIGTYNVNLTVSDGTNYATSLQQVYSPNPTVANFLINQSIGYQYPFPVTFTNASYGMLISNWTYLFGDTYTSTLQNPQHIYTVAGNYTVNLTVYNATSGFSSVNKYVQLNTDDDTYLKSWKHFNSSILNDEKGVTWSAFGTPTLDTSVKKFGAGSLYVPTGNNYIYSPSSSIWDRSPFAGELEFQINVSAYGDAGKQFIRRSSGTDGTANGWGFFNINGTRYGNAFWYGSGSNYTTPFDLPPNTWNHVALVRDTNQYWNVYVNGVKWGTPVYMGGLNVDTTNQFMIGSSGPGAEPSFRIDEFRYSQGVPRFVSNFSVPYDQYRGSLTGGIDPNPNSIMCYKTDPANYLDAIVYNQTKGGIRNRTVQIQNVTYAKYVSGAISFDPLHTKAVAVRVNSSTYSDLIIESSSIDNTAGTAAFNVSRGGVLNITALGDTRTSFADIQMLYHSYSTDPIGTQTFAYGWIGDGGAYPIHNFIATNMTYGMWGTPAIEFSVNTTTPNIYSAVQFTDASTNYPTAWTWNFGDGTTSTLKNPTHSYTSLGTFDVTLTAYQSLNASITNTSTKTGYITVTSTSGAPVASFTGSPTTVGVSSPVSFADASTGSPTSWSWTFGDSSTSTLQNPTHAYGSIGLYTVNLTVANVNGTSTLSRAAYINVTATPPVSNTTTVQDIYLDPSYLLTLHVTDSSNGNVIPNATVIDYVTGITTYTDYSGTVTLNEAYGTAAGVIQADGYNSKVWSYVMDADRDETVQLSTATPSNVQSQVYPKYVTFHVKDGSMFGQPLDEVEISMIGISTSTGSYDWVVQLLGIPLSEVPINSSLMTQSTDSLGMATFYVIPTNKYNVTFTKAGYTIAPMILVPQDDNYIVTATSTESPFYRNGEDELTAVNISVTTTLYNASHAFINLTYNDSTLQTTGGYIEVLQKSDTAWAAPTRMAYWPVTGNSFSNSTVIVHIQQVSGYVSANVSHSEFGSILRTYPYSFNSVPVQFLGFGQDITLIVALGIMMFTVMLGGAAHARMLVVVVATEGWIFYTMHWFQSLFDRGVPEGAFTLALTLVFLVGIIANILMRKKRGL